MQPSVTGHFVQPMPPHRWARFREKYSGYVFLIPWLIGFFVFTIGPILASLYLSFTHYDLMTSPEWAGLFNFERLLTRDTRFGQSMMVTFTFVFVSVPLQLIIALLIALVLNRGIRGLPWYRALFYLPSLLGGSVAIAILWRQVFGNEGLLNQVLMLFGIEGQSWIGSPDTALLTLIVLRVWQFGSPMVIFLAGLKQVPQSLYEAAEIDGAGSISKFFKITLPLITPIFFFNLVLQMISAFQAFTPAYIISDGTGSPADSTLFYSLYIYIQGFRYFRMGYAAAMAWIMLVIIVIFTIINFLLSKFWVFYGDDE
ncbi:sugar ABC transporter permease [Phototrophicus methaneseepsis]|uniref:Sugar ABC transporter permease n=1 Tax=Phototrophicus methaneseepsis TaxID=2710758 RepID=A0A7S8IFQ6_9CHLR|nr:sugar ABC transporter permease [Phototrophicus methaneseepsis]QPC83729.1 sugar ABC transporter permease [Phototrophicus methaneseepsis]